MAREAGEVTMEDGMTDLRDCRLSSMEQARGVHEDHGSGGSGAGCDITFFDLSGKLLLQLVMTQDGIAEITIRRTIKIRFA
jgi:hypothetical protein